MIPTRAARYRHGAILVLPGVWVAAVVTWELLSPLGTHFVQLLAAAPAIACVGTGRRQCVLLGGGCALFALVPLGPSRHGDQDVRLGTCCAILVVIAASYLTSRRGLRLTREVERFREIAATTQHVLLRPLPSLLDGLALAAGHLSASEGALVGGDLYEALATRHGVRVVMGDVRGHGLPALATVAALLGSFREAAYDEPELPGVLRRLERAFHRRPVPEEPSSDEEFATVLLLEIRPGTEVVALNCGHPWPHRVVRAADGSAHADVLSCDEPLPPLGLFPLPAEPPVRVLARLLPGEFLVLHTDGVEDARDTADVFFPFSRALAEAGRGVGGPGVLVERVRAALLRHTRGVVADDCALLALRNDRPRCVGALPPGVAGAVPVVGG
ncbi:PP2C family protein-serine/threonine phosphatase [Streptomyces luteireticuli]|uniref:PP2C family protein-serine/threonine phosphatase n=1 Tax=Streptomyces luteireticuli TaxID=173858 RepID=A0ABN0YY73_9ACTN